MRKTLIVLLAVGAAALGWTQGSNVATLRKSSAVDWKVSGSLPPGVEIHLIHEDPKTRAVESLVRYRSKFSLPSHSHSHDETLVVISGKLVISMNGQEETLDSGSYAFIPAGTSHSMHTTRWSGCKFLVSLNGPFDLKGLEKQKP